MILIRLTRINKPWDGESSIDASGISIPDGVSSLIFPYKNKCIVHHKSGQWKIDAKVTIYVSVFSQKGNIDLLFRRSNFLLTFEHHFNLLLIETHDGKEE